MYREIMGNKFCLYFRHH